MERGRTPPRHVALEFDTLRLQISSNHAADSRQRRRWTHAPRDWMAKAQAVENRRKQACRHIQEAEDDEAAEPLANDPAA